MKTQHLILESEVPEIFSMTLDSLWQSWHDCVNMDQTYGENISSPSDQTARAGLEAMTTEVWSVPFQMYFFQIQNILSQIWNVFDSPSDQTAAQAGLASMTTEVWSVQGVSSTRPVTLFCSYKGPSCQITTTVVKILAIVSLSFPSVCGSSRTCVKYNSWSFRSFTNSDFCLLDQTCHLLCSTSSFSDPSHWPKNNQTSQNIASEIQKNLHCTT